MKTDINTILKKGAATKIKYVDYSSPAKQRQLKKLKEKAELVLKNKYPNPARLAEIFINR